MRRSVSNAKGRHLGVVSWWAVASGLSLSAPALAQDTGMAPITVLDRAWIEASGRTSVGEILQLLPSQSNGINLQFNRGGNGATQVNLRGLGASQTLVLVNGRRFVAGGTGADTSVDLNALPISIIERIEILKDGASAVYGSNAVGGVVNIVTRRERSGVQAALFTGAGEHGGAVYQVSAAAGEVTDRAAIQFAFEYFNRSELFTDERAFSQTELRFDFDTGRQTELGRTASPQGYIRDRSGEQGNAAWRRVAESSPPVSSPAYYNDPEEGWRPFQAGEGALRSDLYNDQPENYLVTPQERYSLFTSGHYAIAQDIRGYFEGSYTNRRSAQLRPPTPLSTFSYAPGTTVSAQNVYNPFGRDMQDVRRTIVEGSNQTTRQDIDTYRVLLGVDGALPAGLGLLSAWRWDAHFIYGRTEGIERTDGAFVISRLRNALGPSFIDASGLATCGTGPDATIPDCVPLDLFGGEGSITENMIDYVGYSGTARGFSEQQLWGVDLSGPLFTAFDHTVGLSLGYQHRREEGGFIPDPIAAAGDTTGVATPPLTGQHNVSAAYAEISIPIAARIPGLQLLELSAAGRWVDFSSLGSELSWKLGGRWQVSQHFALRGSASRSFRAPSFRELFAPGERTVEVTDPCSTAEGSPDDVTFEACRAQGVPELHADEGGTISTEIAGNADLDAETAHTLNGGIIVTPQLGRWANGLSMTVDYWSIDVDNRIQPFGVGAILSNCYRRPAGTREGCDRVERAADGVLVRVRDALTNAGHLRTAGWDFGLDYRLPTNVGRFGLGFDATWLQKFDVTQPDGATIEGAGTYDLRDFTATQTAVFARFRFNAALRYAYRDFSAGTFINYVGPFRECDKNSCRAEPGTPAPASRPVASFVTTDVYASYRVRSPLGETRIHAGVNNLLDAAPPTIYNGQTANSDAAAYDFVGRYFYLSLAQAF